MDMKKLEKLVDESGLITHQKVISKLREMGWKILVSPYYYDNISDNVKEIDIIAEKQFNSASRASDSSQQVCVQLFIECKYIKQPIVFWFDQMDKSKAVRSIEHNTSLEVLYGPKHAADITPDKFHYLASDQVAKLFTTNANRDDVVYKSITQVLNAKTYYDQQKNEPLFFPFNTHAKSRGQLIRYPIVICDNYSEFSKVVFKDGGYDIHPIDKQFQAEINYTYLDKDKKAKSDCFLIDFVNTDGLEDFISDLEREVGDIKEAISFK